MKNKVQILFVDDILCTPGEQKMIIGEYGSLQRETPPFEFHFETAETGPGRYGPEPVLEYITRLPELGAVVLDIMFGDDDDRMGLKILESIRRDHPTLPVLMMTSVDKSQLDVVERSMELGANEYLNKMPTLKEFQDVLRIYTQPSTPEADFAIWGNTAPIRDVRALIARVASGGTASVLVTGESGTGKELVARALHRQGPRRRGPFIDKNCAYEKADLLDSDLFGHEKGAFTGAHQQHIGRIERANGGTLFLDEIGRMTAELQGKLLRVLETRRFQRLGGARDVDSDFQLVCATNEDAASLVEQGQLREDLYFRIRQIEIRLPPLRERVEDIPILANLFLRRFRSRGGASYRAQRIDAKASERLSSYAWPGNVRELRNVVERAAILCRDSAITVEYLPAEVVTATGPATLARAISATGLPARPEEWAVHRVRVQLETIEHALRLCDGNATVAVKYLFPQVNSPNATYLRRYIERLQRSPWGAGPDQELTEIAERILGELRRRKK